MPKLPTLKVPVLEELERELRFAPKEALLLDIERAEELAGEIAADGIYPEDWVVFRVTGYRRGGAGTGVAPGSALLSELSAFVERLCDAAGLKVEEYAPPEFVPPEELCRRWRISRKTLDRERRKGLVARRVRGADGKSRLVFRREVVERFESARGGAAYQTHTRIAPEVEDRMIARAERYHRCSGLSLSASAKRIAARFDRSHEAVRQLLLRAEEQSPIFAEAGPLDARKRAVARRAWRLGIDPALIARRYRRSLSGVRRALHIARAEQLREILDSGALAGPSNPAFERDGAPGVLLTPAPVLRGLGAPGPTDLLEFILAARKRQPPIGVEEHARAVAYQYLRFSAAREITLLDRLHPSAHAIDRVETMLRWAARLKAELMRPQFRLVMETIELRLGRPAEEASAGSLVGLLRESIGVLAETTDQFDPFRAGRLAAPAGLAVDKLVSRKVRELPAHPSAARRASALLSRGVVIGDWTREVSSWQRVLEPDRRLRAVVEARDDDASRFLRERFGWSGEPPRTLSELCLRFHLSSIRVVIHEQRCMADALRRVREGKK